MEYDIVGVAFEVVVGDGSFVGAIMENKLMSQFVNTKYSSSLNKIPHMISYPLGIHTWKFA